MLSNANIGKWQIALILGTSIGIGITYLYWRRSTIPELPDEDDNKKKKKVILESFQESLEILILSHSYQGVFGSISIDKEDTAVTTDKKEDKKQEELTPLEKSLKFKVEGEISSDKIILSFSSLTLIFFSFIKN